MKEEKKNLFSFLLTKLCKLKRARHCSKLDEAQPTGEYLPITIWKSWMWGWLPKSKENFLE